MQIIYHIISLLEKTDKNKYHKLIRIILFPLYYIMEIICFFYFWKFIKNEFLTNEEMVEFLDKNEFGYKWRCLYKKDIITPEDFLNKFKDLDLKIKIKQEFSEAILSIIKKISVLDLENYINIFVDINIDGNSKIRWYSLEIRYYRWYFIKTGYIFLIIWSISVTILYLITNYLNINL